MAHHEACEAEADRDGDGDGYDENRLLWQIACGGILLRSRSDYPFDEFGKSALRGRLAAMALFGPSRACAVASAGVIP